MSFVVEAIARRRVGAFSKATSPVEASTTSALGAETSVPWEYVPDTATAVAAAAASGYHVAAIENSPQAINLYEWTPAWPVCLVFGHETDGVAADLARGIPTHVRIPMLGEKRSLNVATAAGVVLYELLRRSRM